MSKPYTAAPHPRTDPNFGFEIITSTPPVYPCQLFSALGGWTGTVYVQQDTGPELRALGYTHWRRVHDEQAVLRGLKPWAWIFAGVLAVFFWGGFAWLAWKVIRPVIARLFVLVVLVCSLHARQWWIDDTGGPSMLPTLPDAPSKLLVEDTPFDEIVPGDVVVNRMPWKNINACHRIKWKPKGFPNYPGWIIKGDGNPEPDLGLCTPDTYIARVVLALKDGRMIFIAAGHAKKGGVP